jgi:cyclophilin family peptidyl-prolyl cis-trans isomerase
LLWGEEEEEKKVSVPNNIANYMQTTTEKRWLHTGLHRVLVFFMIKTLHL